MKKIATLFVIFSFLGIFNLSAQVQVPNGGFETWSNVNTPTSWNVVSMLGLNNCFQTTDVYAGTYAARLRTTDTVIFTQAILVPGLITLGTIDIVNQTVTGGVPCTDRPDAFEGFFKFSPIGGDTINAFAYFWTYDSITGKDTVGEAFFDTTGSFGTYTAFSVEVKWDSLFVGTPDSMNIVLSNCGLSPHGGTQAYYDGLSFYYSSTGISQSLGDLFNKAYPNPTNGILNIPTMSGTDIYLYNMTGNMVRFEKASKEIVQMNIGDLPKGMYLLRQINNDESFTSKIVLQ